MTTPSAAAAPASTPSTATPAVAVWTGRGSHLTPRNGGSAEELEQQMMADAAKVSKAAKARPKSAVTVPSSREWASTTDEQSTRDSRAAPSAGEAYAQRTALRAVPVNVANGRRASGAPKGDPPSEGEPEPAPAIEATSPAPVVAALDVIPAPISAHDETLIFVDWDDTLLCTHELIERQNIDIDRQRNPRIPQAVVSQLKKLQNDCIDMLEACMQLGTLILVTNAAPGWIERSGQLCLPKLISWIKQHRIECVYARQKVAPAQAGDPTHWKPAAFGQALDVLRTHLTEQSTGAASYAHAQSSSHLISRGWLSEIACGCRADVAIYDAPRINILSIGDGVYERVAARVAAQPQDLVKTLKLVDSPSIAQLRQQLKLATQMLPEVVASDHSRSLTLRSILPNEKPAATATPQPTAKSSPAVTPLDSPGGGGGGGSTPQAGSSGGGGNALTKGLRSAKVKIGLPGGNAAVATAPKPSARRRIDL